MTTSIGRPARLLAGHLLASSASSDARTGGVPTSGIRTSSDSVLVVAVGRRDQEALAELYQRHGGSVFSVALRVLSVRGLAEEVVQDIFTRLWECPERFDPARGSLRSFVLAQAHSRAVDIIRSESARRRREEGDAKAFLLEKASLDPTVGDKVHEMMGTLSEAEREAISLAYFGGHTYVDVALRLGVPEGTVKGRIRSGLARLRIALVEAGGDPPMANTAAS